MMMSLFSYIFVKSHWLCVNVFKEKEFPEYFASGVVAMIVVGTITVTADIIGYLVNPDALIEYGGVYKYFSLSSLLLFWLYFGYMKKYMIFMNHFRRISDSKKKVLKIISFIYLIVLIVAFFGMGNIIRDYNLSNR